MSEDAQAVNKENVTGNRPREGQKLEFKTTIFIDPKEETPGFRQMQTIAKSLAAFMNAVGGDLWVGVTDDGDTVGMGGDLAILANQTSLVAVRSPRYSDVGFTYDASEDHYELKIRALARAYLSPNAAECIDKVAFVKANGVLVCCIKVKPCKPDEVVYFYEFQPRDKTEVEQIYVRDGNHKIQLKGRARDEFVRRRVEAGFDRQLEALRASMEATGNGAQNNEAVVSAVRELLAKLQPQELPGQKITVSGGQPFTKEAVTAVKKPKSLAWEEQHYAEVSGWQELVLKVLEKLQEINPAKFDELAGQKEFAKQLIVISKPRERPRGCYSTKFGADGKIRVKSSLGNKVYLWDESKALRKLIAAFGVDVSKFAFVAK